MSREVRRSVDGELLCHLVLTRDLARWLTAPIGLACPHGEEEGSALVLGIGLRLWQSALSFPSLSFIYKSIVFLPFG